MASDSISAITDSLPPTTDYLTYLTILESHLSTAILPTLNNILQDAVLTQNIGWDLVHLLLPLQGAEQCLSTIARLGNPREVLLKVTESLQLLQLEPTAQDEEDAIEEYAKASESTPSEPTAIDLFCILLNLLSALHPRIKTNYPSRFLSASLMAILSTFRPSNQATLAVIAFVHSISGKKRPSLPGRKSSLNIPTTTPTSEQPGGPPGPDPEAQDEEPHEAAIQTKLLQSFITHVLEEYVNANPLEWAARLLESFHPEKVVLSRRSLGESFRVDPELQIRDTIVGQLVALGRDLGLSDYGTLFEAVYRIDAQPSENDEENYPSSPGDIPLSRAGSLFLISSFIFSSILFESTIALPTLAIFPDHAKLAKQFIGTDHPGDTGSEDPGVSDAVLALGLWLEHSNSFVSGPLEDEDFLQYLQSISLISAINASPTLRYDAHVLTSSVLHAHPVDRLRLTFISDTLENCPFESLKASAVSWLKEEILKAEERKSDNIFSSPVALAAVQPYLFLDMSSLLDLETGELIPELAQAFPFHMAVLNFLIFIAGKQHSHVVPPGMMTIVEEIYVEPLRTAQQKALEALNADGDVLTTGIMSQRDVDGLKMELSLLGDRMMIISAADVDR